MEIILKTYNLLNNREKKWIIFLFFFVFISSIIEIIGLASILPLLYLITDNQVIDTNNYIKKIYEIFLFFGFEGKKNFLIFFSLLVFLIFITSIMLRCFTQYAHIRFTQMREYSLSIRILKSYLSRPYSWFLNNSSNTISKNILSEISGVIDRAIIPLLNILVYGILIILILFFLFFINWRVTIIIILTFFLIYSLIFFIFKKKIKKIGADRLDANEQRFQYISKTFSAIKQIKVRNLENFFINNFDKNALTYSKLQTLSLIIAQLPRHLVEGVAFGGIIVLILVMIFNNMSLIDIVPALSIYLFSGYRLLPAMQQVYFSSSQLRFASISIDNLSNTISNSENLNCTKDFQKKKFNKSIVLKNISYIYPFSKNLALKNINLSILKNETIGFFGKTGSGKTTIVDIILGLLNPTEGELIIDGNVINKTNIEYYKNNFSYVPQNIFLSNDSIADNIVFGENFDQKLIEKAAKMANIHDFIIQTLPQGYNTIVGKSGVRLSGGQRQRIAIARAFYNNSKILVLDESTNALDHDTEFSILNELKKSHNDLTLILISHRLETFKYCDKIYTLENGELKLTSKFEELNR